MLDDRLRDRLRQLSVKLHENRGVLSLHLAAVAAGADGVLEKHELERGLVERLAAARG